MKQKLLFLLLFSFFVGFVNAKATPPTGPSIALIMQQSYSDGYTTYFNFSIKNNGTETVTNVYVSNTPTNSSNINIYTQSGYPATIASLAPGQEVTNYFYGNKTFNCFDQSQAIVYATTAANTQISDLSSPGDYYSDNLTYSFSYAYADGTQSGVYEDTNNNQIIDVGDVINYTYNISVYSSNVGISIYDNNAIVYNPYLFNTTGIHYITQADIDLGYVYNSSTVTAHDTCGNINTTTLTDETPCTCPNPNNANIITQLTTLLPNQISGTIKYNFNNDNCLTGEAFTSRRVNTTDNTNRTYSSFTNSNGQYHILIPNTGTYTTTPLTNLGQNYSSTPTATTLTSSGQNQNYANNDFCISSATAYGDLVVGMYNYSNAIPGSNAGYNIYYYNDGSTALSGTIQLTFDGTKMTFTNASTNPNSTTANTITWNYTNLLPFQSGQIGLQFAIQTPPTTNINDPLTFTVFGTPTAGDNNPANNTFSFIQIVRSSYDPNNKTVIEGDFIDIAQTNNYLNYVTRFQNSGTANATTVVIQEHLNPNLDWDTFQPIASSHSTNVQIRNGNEVTYTFSNINLPYQSANEPASHGWMAYRIKPKTTIALGDVMTSSSAIYFDYNPPIYTNYASTQVTALATTNFIKSNFSVYPNPAANYIIIEAKTNVDAIYEIIDINGKSQLKGTTQSLQPINIANLQSGFYFITIKTEQGKAIYKLIKN